MINITKKDYVKFAELFKKELSDVQSMKGCPSFGEVDIWEAYEEEAIEIIRLVSGLFAKDNPKFDETKFLVACGVKER